MKDLPEESAGLEELKSRLGGIELETGAGGSLDLRGKVLANRDLSGLDLSGADLSGADLSGANLSNATLVGADLSRAKLHGAQLDGAEFLDARMVDVNLSQAKGEGVGFARADLTGAFAAGARLINGSWSEACLERANFGGATLKSGRFRGANLSAAQFVRADLRGTDLSMARLGQTNFNLADLRGCGMSHVTEYKSSNWIGANVLDVDFHGAYLVRRHLMDENYLYEFRKQGTFNRVLYWIWWATSDCGRSLARWTAWVVVVIIVYGLAYSFADVDFGRHETSLSPLYFSIVTITTLGYGDVIPASTTAQVLAVSEAIFGYIGLGGLLSIFSQKMARRAE